LILPAIKREENLSAKILEIQNMLALLDNSSKS